MLFITKNIISFINCKLISPFPRHVFKIYLRLIMLHENKFYPYLGKGIFAVFFSLSYISCCIKPFVFQLPNAKIQKLQF